MALNNGNLFFKTLVTFIILLLILQACSPKVTLQVRKLLGNGTCQVTVGAWVLNANCN